MPHFRRLQTARRRAAAILGLALVGSRAGAQPRDTPQAGAEESALRMTWQSTDPTCSGDDVATRALRSVSPGVVPRPLRAQVDVQREGDRWVVRLQTESGDQSGRRILRAESCDEIRRAIALLLAMAMESRLDALPGEAPPAPTAPPATEPPATLPPANPAAASGPNPPLSSPNPEDDAESDDAPVAAQPRDAGGLDVGVFVRLDGRVAHGLKPGLGLGAGLSAGLRIGEIDVGVSAAAWPNTRARVLDRSGRVRISRQNLGLRACWNVWAAAGWVLAPCVAPELTFFQYASERVETPVDGSAGPLPSVSAAVDLRYELIDGRLSLLVSPTVTWERPQPFRITFGGSPTAGQAEADPEFVEIYKTTGLGPGLEIGVDARF